MAKQKSFIITVDTEGDNLWAHREGMLITTRNAEYIPRFQELCDSYGFKPVYLTNYEMACSDIFVDEATKWHQDKRCEIGIHLHAWNNPPLHDLKGAYSGQSYLIEYPADVMEAKFRFLIDLLKERFKTEIVSHRSGRWAMNSTYFDILQRSGIKVDCSVTPHISWESSKGITRGGSDYRHMPETSFLIDHTDVFEVPMTVRCTHLPIAGSWRHRIKTLLTGTPIWLRPAMFSSTAMKWLIDHIEKETSADYLEFMIHSSELMPGGSPYAPAQAGVERIFDRMKRTFDYAASKGYKGLTLAEYHSRSIESLK